MDKRIKWFIGTLIVAVFLAFMVWFWSLGAVASEDVPQIRLEVSKPSVEVKRRDTADWITVETATEVQIGDSIKTDVGGEAEIRWGDSGVTRLDPATTLTVEAVPADPSSVTQSIIKLRVETGRVWSRVLKLFGPEAAFEVRTDNVVSTVRGTAFGVGLAGTSTEVMVNQGVVESAPVTGGNGVFVRQGRMGSFGDDGALRYLRDLNSTDTWAEVNRKLDETFDKALAEEVAIRFGRMQKPAPEWLTELSEDVHLGFAGDGAKHLAGYYARRRVAALALGRNSRFDKDFLGMMDDPGEHERLLGQVRLALQLARHPEVAKKFGDPGGHKLDSLEDLRKFLLDDGKAGSIDARLIGLGEGMFKAWDNEDRSNEDWLKDQVGQVRDDLAKTEDMTEAVRYVLDRNALALLDIGSPASSTVETTSTQSEQPAAEAGDASEPEKQTSVPVQTTTIKPTTVANPTMNAAQIQPAACNYRSVTLTARPERGAKVGDAVTLALSGTCPDGTTNDLTAQARFNPGLPTDGKIDGRIFYPAKDGSIVLYGTTDIGGMTRVAKTTISVDKAAKKLMSLKVSALGPTTITTGQSVALQAMAEYSDGSTSDITYQCGWLTSDQRLAMVTNQRLQSLSGTGDVSATCNYTENGVTVFGSLMFTIVLDPALQPNLGKPPTQQYPGTYTIY
ncbi:FecR domain-containing protein [Candidatus Uhrbacteria bacterium]|nr:FecR domain-containing protein [Candidatus Uhrbacteria bacterium]